MQPLEESTNRTRRGALPAARPARRRRHGPGLPGPQRRRPHGRRQDRASALRAGRGVPGAVPARGRGRAAGGRRLDRAGPGRRPGGARCRGWPPAYAAGPSLSAGGRRPRAAARALRTGPGRGTRRGAGGGARAGPGAPGREAVQRAAHPRRPPADRLRDRPGHRRHRLPHLHRRLHRLARLHVARADPRQGRHGRGRRLLAGRGPRLRGDRRAALPRRLLRRPPLQGRPRGARNSARSTASCGSLVGRAAWPRTRRPGPPRRELARRAGPRGGGRGSCGPGGCRGRWSSRSAGRRWSC